MFVKRLARARMFDYAIQSLISQQRSVSARKGFSFVNRVGIHRSLWLVVFTLMKVDRGHRKFSVYKPTIDRMNHSSEIKSNDRHRQSVFTKIYFIHNKENNIRNIFRTFMFQQLLANKHRRLRDSVPITIWPSGGLRLVTDKKKNNKKLLAT